MQDLPVVELHPEVELQPQRKFVAESTPEAVQVDTGGVKTGAGKITAGVVSQESPVVELKPEVELQPETRAFTDVALKPSKTISKANENNMYFFI